MAFPLLFLIGLTAADAPSGHPASDAAVEAFVAAMPPSQADADPGQAFDQDRLERLVELNPGREAEVRRVHHANEQCEAASKERAVEEALRSTAQRLGDEKLTRMIAFYKGRDHELFGQLTKKPESELTSLEKSELERILTTYPLNAFNDSMRVAEKAMWNEDGLLGALMDCHETLQAEFARRGLRN